MRILIITDSLPYPPNSGDKIRTYNLLRRISDHHEVWLACLLDGADYHLSLAHLEEFCRGVEVAVIRAQHPLVHLPGLIWYALVGRPLELKFVHSEELARKIHRLVLKEKFDIIQIEHSFMAMYLDAIPQMSESKSILTFHNVTWKQFDTIFRYERRLILKIRHWIFSKMMRKWEPNFAQRFNRCITVSEVDKELLKNTNPSLHIDIVPNGVDVKDYQLLPRQFNSRTLLFIGKMSYLPCIDAALYFYEEILPLIRLAVDNVDFWIVGRDPTPEILKLHGSNATHVSGYVDDVVPYYKNSAICVVPLRAGGGTRLKILEAMALGRPVVSSTIGCEGLDVTDGKNILIADSPGQFAAETVKLLTDRVLYQNIVNEARKLVETHYDWNILASRLLQTYDELANDCHSSSLPNSSGNN